MPTRSVRYPPPPFTHVQQANEANPQPPDPSTIPQPYGSMPPNWVHPRDPATTSVARWPFANRYIFKLILEMFQWGTKFEKDLRENHVFDTDTNMQAYFRRYYANEKNMKEDWFAMNLLLFKTIVNLMRYFRAEAANHTVAPVMREVEDFFTYFSLRFNQLFDLMRQNRNFVNYEDTNQMYRIHQVSEPFITYRNLVTQWATYTFDQLFNTPGRPRLFDPNAEEEKPTNKRNEIIHDNTLRSSHLHTAYKIRTTDPNAFTL